eukprot:g16840.t1
MWLSMEHILLKLQRPSRAVDRRSVDRSDVSDLQDSGFALVRQKESKEQAEADSLHNFWQFNTAPKVRQQILAAIPQKAEYVCPKNPEHYVCGPKLVEWWPGAWTSWLLGTVMILFFAILACCGLPQVQRSFYARQEEVLSPRQLMARVGLVRPDSTRTGAMPTTPDIEKIVNSEFTPEELEGKAEVTGTDPDSGETVVLEPADPWQGIRKLMKALEESMGRTTLDRRGELRRLFYQDLKRNAGERISTFCTRFRTLVSEMRRELPSEELGWFLRNRLCASVLVALPWVPQWTPQLLKRLAHQANALNTLTLATTLHGLGRLQKLAILQSFHNPEAIATCEAVLEVLNPLAKALKRQKQLQPLEAASLAISSVKATLRCSQSMRNFSATLLQHMETSPRSPLLARDVVACLAAFGAASVAEDDFLLAAKSFLRRAELEEVDSILLWHALRHLPPAKAKPFCEVLSLPRRLESLESTLHRA